eukprot:9461193-Lingulodinium_polyedra.AAC.1
MDFMDAPTPRIRQFNVRIAKPSAWGNTRNCAETCGYAFRSKMRYRFPGMWKTNANRAGIHC